MTTVASSVGILSRISYHPGLVRMVHRVGLRRPLSAAYFWWHRPADGVARVDTSGVTGAFYVQTSWQLRWLESINAGRDLDPDLLAMLDFVRPGDVVFDIGANLGVFAVLLAKRVSGSGRVVAFEPQRRVFDHLERNVALNRLANVSTARVALGHVAGHADMSLANENVLSSLRHKSDRHTARERVEVVVGDEYRTRTGLPVPRAVKIDVEGAEYSVIRGLRKTLADPRCELLCCEIHPPLLPPSVGEREILGLIGDLGFRTVTVHPFETWSVAVCRKGEVAA